LKLSRFPRLRVALCFFEVPRRARFERSARLALCFLLAVVLSLPPGAGAQESAPKVVSVSVSGNAHIPADRILAVVKTKVGDRFDEATVRSDLQAIFDLGYFSDQAPPVIRQRTDGIAITYRVIENPVIQRITFDGNKNVPSDTLLALMDTATGQVFNTNTFHQDVLKINSYYDKIGYGGQVPSHVADLNIDPKTGELKIQIREGLTVGDIKITGDPVLPPAVILPALSLKKGQPYSDETRDKDYDNLKKLYEKYDLELGDFEAGIDPSSVDLKTGTANVSYSISVARVGAVEITGNTITHDIVIRRQLLLRPGMIITVPAIRRDYERLNGLGYFEKVELNTKGGPDPKKPAEITLDWNVKEQRTGTATIGLGYSGGANGAGLTGNLGFSQSNINGSGNGANFRFERGARLTNATVSLSVPYLGNTKKSQRYSLGASIFAQTQTNYYQAYSAGQVGSTGVVQTISTPGPGGVTGSGQAGYIPVTLQPNNSPLSGEAAEYKYSQIGGSVNLGRRLTPYDTATVGVIIQQIKNEVNVGYPYYVSGSTTILTSTQSSIFGTQSSNALGISAPSIASQNNNEAYALHALTGGFSHDNQDNPFNPRNGIKLNATVTASGSFLGSDFGYTLEQIDVAKFYPVLKSATFGLHGVFGTSTGALPVSSLYAFSDQQLRGYSNVYYGTNELLLQAELRVPLTPDKKFSIVGFGDFGDLKIRGAAPVVNAFGQTLSDYGSWTYHGDVGAGIRFDLPQLGFKSVRIDLARGYNQWHTSFGIGQSF
jgi:outer membrane protein assembly factor BamA